MSSTDETGSFHALGRDLDDRSFRLLVDSVKDYAILMLDPAGHVVSWNAGALAIKGYAAEEILGAHFSRFYPPESLAHGLPRYELEVASREGRFEDEGWRVRKDGTRFWANVVITALYDERGRLIGFCNVTRDLTERRRHEEGLRLSEERYRTLVDGVKDYAIFVLDPKGFVATWNTGAEHLKGYQASEIVGSHFSRFYPPDAIRRGLPAHELHVATMDGRFEDEGWRVCKDGSRFWANVVITAMRDRAGALIGFSKVTRDLTERRRHEEALRHSEERLRQLIEAVTEYSLVMLDGNGFVTSWNGGAERISGYQAHEIIGKHFSHFYPAEDISSHKPWQHLKLARETGRVQEEAWRVRKDGTLYWASSTLTTLHDSEGRPYAFAQVGQDLSERRHAEALADTAQRMHEFIAMLAHELRNPLAPIRNAVALMGKKGLGDPTLEAMRQTIDRQSAHLTRILDELLDVNRVSRGEFSVGMEAVDLQELLSRAVETSRPLIDAQGHRLRVVAPDTPVSLQGDPVRLTQVLVNILNNAAKYTAAGGKIWVTASIRGMDVEIRIRDSGKGIAPDNLERIFDLFMQVEPNSNSTLGGLGVGLALVRRVVELHGGSVQARSEGPGRGTEFIVRLPLPTEQLRVIQEAGPAIAHRAGRLRVLVVDDNRDAADSLSLLLQSMNQDVRTVYDGAAALSAAGTLSPDVVMLDIGMPFMGGYEVAKKLAGMGGAMPVLVAVTGWGQEEDKQRAREAGFSYHLVKPVSYEALEAALAEISSTRIKDAADLSGAGS
ncbi:MAG: PAS domain S-box protein [Steroidobacteraceae bacterium]